MELDKDSGKEIAKAVAIESIKVILGIINTGLPILVEGGKKYIEYRTEKNTKKLIDELTARTEYLENINTKEFYLTENGKEISNKIIACILNDEYSDKTEFFVNALLNAPNNNLQQYERLKFIEVLRNVSKPALLVLAEEYKLQQERGKGFSPQILIDDLITSTSLDGHLVASCVNELYSLGIFSNIFKFDTSGRVKSHFENGVPSFTDFSKKFIEFIKDPRI